MKPGMARLKQQSPVLSYQQSVFFLTGDGANSSTSFPDSGPHNLSVSAFGSTQVSTAQSKSGGASILFNGTTDRLVVPFDSSMNLVIHQDWSFSAWLRPTTLGGVLRCFFSRQSNSSGLALQFRVNTSSHFEVVIRGVGQGGAQTITGSLTVAINTNYDIEIRCRNDAITIYVNGAVDASASLSITANNNLSDATLGMTVGALYDGAAVSNWYAGYMDNAQFIRG